MFPKATDHHKPNKPLVPNGLGVIYVLISSTYLFLVYFLNPVEIPAFQNVSPALTLAVCVLFGGFLGLLDDWMDLRWRFKAFFPLISAIPLISLASRLGLRTSIDTVILGAIDFGAYYYFLIIPLIVTVTTNTVNQLGGLNGLETICPAIIMFSLMALSGTNAILVFFPMIIWIILAYQNFKGKIFVGNTGSFAIGMTLAAFAIISDLKSVLLLSLLPYIFNSTIILLNFFLKRTKAHAVFDGKKLYSSHRRSLITLIAYYRPITERRLVLIISFIVAAFASTALILQWTSL
jgi:UDP-N-acetylglucosamine--dolichyl-phosphate N-acetylglucosaminephosphotransferase